MEKFVINGGKPLKGEVRISGAKNAAVAILPAVLLSDEPCIIENLPNISDVATILKAMQVLGAQVKLINKSTVEIDPRHVNSFVVSNSCGDGASRRVVIAVEGGDIRPPRRDNGKRDGYSRRRAPQKPEQDAPAREPKRDSDMPLYGKIN